MLACADVAEGAFEQVTEPVHGGCVILVRQRPDTLPDGRIAPAGRRAHEDNIHGSVKQVLDGEVTCRRPNLLVPQLFDHPRRRPCAVLVPVEQSEQEETRTWSVSSRSFRSRRIVNVSG